MAMSYLWSVRERKLGAALLHLVVLRASFQWMEIHINVYVYNYVKFVNLHPPPGEMPRSVSYGNRRVESASQ